HRSANRRSVQWRQWHVGRWLATFPLLLAPGCVARHRVAIRRQRVLKRKDVRVSGAARVATSWSARDAHVTAKTHGRGLSYFVGHLAASGNMRPLPSQGWPSTVAYGTIATLASFFPLSG